MTKADDDRLRPSLAIAENIANGAASLLAAGDYPTDDLTRVKAMLAATILDGLVAIIALLRSHGQCHAATIVRSMMEAVGDLYHLCSDSSYLDRLRLTSALVEQRNAETFIQLRAGDRDMVKIVDQQKRIAREVKQKVLALSGKTRKIDTGERVSAPNLPPDFVAIYSTNCAEAHHDIVALARRHFRGKELVFGDTLTVSHALISLAQGCLLVTMMAGKIPEFATRLPADAEATILALRKQSETVGAKLNEVLAPKIQAFNRGRART
jgi:hypothetical protein